MPSHPMAPVRGPRHARGARASAALRFGSLLIAAGIFGSYAVAAVTLKIGQPTLDGGGGGGENLSFRVNSISFGETAVLPTSSAPPLDASIGFQSFLGLSISSDLDGDGILDDGDGSGMPGDAPCTGGDNIACDDNCPTVTNSLQQDGDLDGLGNACDEFGDGSDGPFRASVLGEVINTSHKLFLDAPAGSLEVGVDSASGFQSDDEILIIQIQGPGAGTYEYARVIGVGGASLALRSPLHFSYSASNRVANVIRVPQFTTVTVPAGTSISAPAWDGQQGGIVAFRATASVTVEAGGKIEVNAKGFRGGGAVTYVNACNPSAGLQGESILGPSATLGLTTPNVGGGGAGAPNSCVGCAGDSPGGGGGYGTDGLTGVNPGGPGNSGRGGSVYGSCDLFSKIFLGSGGGESHWSGQPGGHGAGAILMFAPVVDSAAGSIEADGQNGSAGSSQHPSGGGSGGSILIGANSVQAGVLGIHARGGAGPSSQPCIPCCANPEIEVGGAGGYGRLHISSLNLAGTTDPGPGTIVQDILTSAVPSPTAMAVSPGGAYGNFMYVVSGATNIYKVAPDGTATFFAARRPGNGSLQGLFFDTTPTQRYGGSLFAVVDYFGGTCYAGIDRVLPNGTLQPFVNGCSGAPVLVGATRGLVDDLGEYGFNMYIADFEVDEFGRSPSTLIRIDPAGNRSPFDSSMLPGITGIDLDRFGLFDGDILATNTGGRDWRQGDNAIWRIRPDGSRAQVIPNRGFGLATDLLIDSQGTFGGNLFVLYEEQGFIVEYNPAGTEVRRMAAPGGVTELSDRLEQDRFGAFGNDIYFAATNMSQIRRIRLGACARESCDGMDDDRDGVIDEEFLADPTTCGAGLCASTGMTQCVDGQVIDTCAPGEPATEVCNGLDDSCDGATDDGFLLDAACVNGTGNCARAGVTACTMDGLGVACNAIPGLPVAELCDGQDNNCDGVFDDGFLLNMSCTEGVGECQRSGATVCSTDHLTVACNVVPGLPAAELCDGLDNDCNATVDDGGGALCDNADACDGVESCGGATGCQGGSPPVCDDANLCTDDSCSPASGCVTVANVAPCDDADACTMADTCSGGACAGGPPPNCDDGEVCTIDTCESGSGCAYAPTNTGETTCGLGECLHTVDNCLGGQSQACDPLEGSVSEVCDGLDNDCDGVADDNGTLNVVARIVHVGQGSSPQVNQVPNPDLPVSAFSRIAGSCAMTVSAGSLSHTYWPAILAGCAADAYGITASTGEVALTVPAGPYLIIGDGGVDKKLGDRQVQVACGGAASSTLTLMVKSNGKSVPAKSIVRTGSLLMVTEPEYVAWSSEAELYPFVFESFGDWGVTTSVAPPEGFVADHDSLSAQVTSETEAVQFVITDIGSDWVPTEVLHTLTHGARREFVRSRIGVKLHPDLARSKGLDSGGRPLDPRGAPVTIDGFDPRLDKPAAVTGWIVPSARDADWTVKVQVNRDTNIKVAITRNGQSVRLLAGGHLAEGEYAIAWNGRDRFGRTLGAGRYHITVISGTEVVDSVSISGLMLIEEDGPAPPPQTSTAPTVHDPAPIDPIEEDPSGRR